jgi:3-keto-5-aminohexanoate cleavage enzyme
MNAAVISPKNARKKAAMNAPAGTTPLNRGQVCVEVALNGAWTRRVQPRMPIAPEQIVAEAVACAEAGASVVHFHAYDVASGEQTTDVEVLARIIEGIRARADVIVYPTVRYLSNAQAIGPDAGELRFAHVEALAERGLLEWMVIDPGSFNLVSQRDVQQGKPGVVDIGAPDAIRHALRVAAKHRLHPGLAIYEPGYLRLGGALCQALPGVPAPLMRLMFSDQFTFGFPPTALALRAYLALLAEVAPDAPWMMAGLGVDLRALIPLAVELGGHVRVGLEDWTLGSSVSNLDLVTQAVRQIVQAGGSAAGAAEVRRGLFAPAALAVS